MKKKFFTFGTALVMFFGAFQSCNNADNEELNSETIKEVSLKSKNLNANKSTNKIVAQNDTDQIILDKLFGSETYLNSDLKKWFINDNGINLTDYRISIKQNEDGVNVPIITLIIRDDSETVIGSLEAISYKDNNEVLNFNILLRNFEKMDLVNGTGNIYMTDLNEGYTYADATIENKNLVSVETYKSLTEKNSISLTAKRRPGDLNGNGDITFAECYMYMNQAIQSNPTTYTLCYFVGDAIGWVVTGWGPLCQYSVAASCVVISAWY
jgi:hypothetical protein